MSTTIVNIKGKDIKIAALPLDAYTASLLGRAIKKGDKNSINTYLAIIEALNESLSKNYDDQEIKEILKDIQLEDGDLINELSGIMFSADPKPKDISKNADNPSQSLGNSSL
jgi:hypothetical protein